MIRGLLSAGIVFCILTSYSSSLYAQEKPFQLSLITPVQVVPAGQAIKGVRLNLIYGRNTAVKGVDLGLVNHTTTGVTKGWQTGLVGVVDTDFKGYQDNWVNVTKGRFEGFQSGIYDHARDMHGFQFGLVNYAETMYGLQVGLINIIRKGHGHPVLPLINWSF